jgi:peptidoglycan/xylan/chitin deacetylase (PgdA/CDA1 family)
MQVDGSSLPWKAITSAMNLRHLVKSTFYRVQKRWGRWAASHKAGEEDAIVIFLLHTITPARSDMAVPAGRFSEQMQALLDAGYRAMAIDQLLTVLSQRGISPGRGFAVTFDDGYRSVLTDALPILEQLHIPATVFLTTGFLDGLVAPPWGATDPALNAEYRGQAQFFQPMNWDEARSLARHPLIRIGSHTQTHPLLGLQTTEVVRNELVHSKSIIRDRLGIETEFFAYPYGVRRYGAYSDMTEYLLRETGYACSMTSEITRARVGGGTWKVPRISLTREDEGRDAVAKAAGSYDWVGTAQRIYQSVFPNPHEGAA